MATTASQQASLSGPPADHLAAIDRRLDECLAAKPGRPERLVEAMRYAVLGPGKRLRPRLVLMAAEACGGEIEPALPAACAVEMIHAYSLAHDDLPAMDDDDLRRGRPTVHRQFDEATAVLAGDALLALAFEVLADGAATDQVASRGCLELAIAAGPGELVGGQSDDLSGAEKRLGETVDIDHLRSIHTRKTGAMIKVSLRLGAISAGASEEQLSALTVYGESLGLAFQVTDDLLDAVGDEQAVGKRVGKDDAAGKLTYPSLLGIEQSRAYAAELVAEAVAALETFGESAEPLRHLAQQILQRDR